MADDRIDVKIGATTGELKTGMDQAGNVVKQGVTGMQTPFDQMRQNITTGMAQTHSQVKGFLDTIGTAINSIGKIALGVGAVLAGGAWFKGAVDTYVQMNSEAKKLSVVMGTNIGDAQALLETYKRFGVEGDTVSRVMMMMTRQLKTNEDAFTDNKIVTRDASGNLLSMNEIMFNAINRLKEMKEGTERNMLATLLFGRSVSDMPGFLKMSEKAAEDMKKRLADLGLTLDDVSAAKARAFKEGMADVGLVMSALKYKVAEEVLPILISMGKWMSGEGQSVVSAFGSLIRGIASAFAYLANQMARTLEYYQSLGNASGPRGGGGGGGWGGEPGDPKPKEPKGGDTFVGKTGSAGAGGGKGGGASLVQQWVAELEQMKAAEEKFQSQSLQMEKAFWGKKLATGKVATQEELEALKAQELASEAIRLKAETDYWKGKLLLAGEGTKDYQEVQHKIVTLEQQQNKARLQSEIELIKNKIKAGQDTIKDKMALIEHESQLDKLDLKMKQNNVAHLAKMGAMSRVAELKEYKKLKQDEHLLDMKAEKDKGLLLKGDEKAYQKHLNDLKLLKKKQALELQQIDFDITEAMKAEWGQVWNSVSQAFSMSVQGIITGTTTLADAIKNIWQSILTSLVGMFLEIALQYIASKVMMLIFGKPADTEMAASAVAAQSAIAGAAGFASVMVALPFPINLDVAPEVGAFAAAMAASFGGLAMAAGGWDVPEDTLAMVHKDEKILPADWPEKLRAVAAPGGGARGGIRIEKLNFAPTLVMKQPMTHAYAHEIVRKYLFSAFEDELERFGANLGRG